MAITLLPSEGRTLPFETPLTEGRIIERPNRFIMHVEVNGEVLRCHSPVTGRIGGLTLNGLPCLISYPKKSDSKRTTVATVEAIALEEKTSPSFQWISINQPAANGYVAAALEANLFAPLLPKPALLQREQKLGSSRIDFLLNGELYLEVKAPLLELAVARPATIPWKDHGLGSPSTRFEDQLQDLTGAIAEGKQAAQLTVFGYQRSGPMSAQEQLGRNITYHPLFGAAEAAGLKRYRVALSLTPTGVTVGELELVPVDSFKLA